MGIRRINMSLSALLSSEDSPDRFAPTLNKLRGSIEARLAELLPVPADERDLVAAAMQDGVLAPGKRLRPLLMLLVGRGLGHQSKALLDLSCAVEMVHAASLFLDDLPCMDNARLRRGRMAVHVRYGEDIAMLGAVALLSHSCCIVASAASLSGSQRAQLVSVMCEAIGLNGLVRGQYRDLREGALARPASDIASANQQKTGSLFSAAFEMAAIAAGAADGTRSSLRAAAADLGHAFQLRDDLEDCADTEIAITKDRNKDAGKSTMVALLGHEAVQLLLDKHLCLAESRLRHALPADDGVVTLMRSAFSGPPTRRTFQPGQQALKLQV